MCVWQGWRGVSIFNLRLVDTEQTKGNSSLWQDVKHPMTPETIYCIKVNHRLLCNHCGRLRGEKNILLVDTCRTLRPNYFTFFGNNHRVEASRSPHLRLGSGWGTQSLVSQSSSSHLTTSPSVHFSDVTSGELRSLPHSRNRDNFPVRVPTRMCEAPRVSVPLGASLQQEGETAEVLLKLQAGKRYKK